MHKTSVSLFLKDSVNFDKTIQPFSWYCSVMNDPTPYLYMFYSFQNSFMWIHWAILEDKPDRYYSGFFPLRKLRWKHWLPFSELNCSWEFGTQRGFSASHNSYYTKTLHLNQKQLLNASWNIISQDGWPWLHCKSVCVHWEPGVGNTNAFQIVVSFRY